jgi:hypothetical protein
MAARPETLPELTAYGWRIVRERLAVAPSELTLVTHWFVTPEDSAVHGDEHFGSDARTARFLGVVVPTLADQLGASLVSVAVPWGLGGETPLLVLVSALPGEAARIEARLLRRVTGAVTAPWWTLGEEQVAPPDELAEIAAQLRI